MSAPKQTHEYSEDSHLMAGAGLGIMEGNSLPGAMQKTTWKHTRGAL